MNIFFDLDGTLIDARCRLYQLFQHLIPQSALSFDEYWDLKRNKISHKEILMSKFQYSEADFKIFEKEWMSCIEQKEWLDLDKPFQGVTDFLMFLKQQQYCLFVVTARQLESDAKEQIRHLGWEHIFNKILVTGQKQEKYEMIKNEVSITKEDYFVGDTGKDIQTGKQLGIKTVAVLSGFLNKEKLLEYHPDYIVENVVNIQFEHK